MRHNELKRALKEIKGLPGNALDCDFVRMCRIVLKIQHEVKSMFRGGHQIDGVAASCHSSNSIKILKIVILQRDNSLSLIHLSSLHSSSLHQPLHPLSNNFTSRNLQKD
ncbi:hypothetical protein AVEN_114862-1 [Araneus ventricosus]|uniref:Uncharacterized protein n=1 Tax=Araneus ventricosus TaxID=182803 RepID=A0A4Y2NB52_ARAVE|nr:hypothetical protein AVEN_114862-1 [Araneus ventricosus]